MQFIAHDGIRHRSEFYWYGNKQSGCKTDEISQQLNSSKENPLDEVCQKSWFLCTLNVKVLIFIRQKRL
jgi:hypothetical protein